MARLDSDHSDFDDPVSPRRQAGGFEIENGDRGLVEPSGVPSAVPDYSSISEVLDLSSAKQVKYEHIQLVARLDGEIDRHLGKIDEQEKELNRLRRIEVDHARLKQANRSKKTILGLCACIAAIGGGLTKYFSVGQYTEWAAVGFAIILIAAMIQLFIATFDG